LQFLGTSPNQQGDVFLNSLTGRRITSCDGVFVEDAAKNRAEEAIHSAPVQCETRSNSNDIPQVTSKEAENTQPSAGTENNTHSGNPDAGKGRIELIVEDSDTVDYNIATLLPALRRSCRVTAQPAQFIEVYNALNDSIATGIATINKKQATDQEEIRGPDAAQWILSGDTEMENHQQAKNSR
jgi:hypothetical protein